MKNTRSHSIKVGLFTLGLMMVSNAEASLCQALMAEGSQPFAPMSWRLFSNENSAEAGTNLNGSGTVSRTTPTREREILRKAMEFGREIMHQQSTPLMDFFPEAGTKMEYIKITAGYGTGEISSIKVSGLGADGILRGTFALPVSGHVSPEMAMKWAKSDFYKIIMENSVTRQRTVLQRAQSKDLTTFQEIEIPLVRDQEITLYYDREGSAGPGGYIEGRALKIVWDGSVSARNSMPRFSPQSPQQQPVNQSLWRRIRDQVGI